VILAKGPEWKLLAAAKGAISQEFVTVNKGVDLTRPVSMT